MEPYFKSQSVVCHDCKAHIANYLSEIGMYEFTTKHRQETESVSLPAQFTCKCSATNPTTKLTEVDFQKGKIFVCGTCKKKLAVFTTDSENEPRLLIWVKRVNSAFSNCLLLQHSDMCKAQYSLNDLRIKKKNANLQALDLSDFMKND